MEAATGEPVGRRRELLWVVLGIGASLALLALLAQLLIGAAANSAPRWSG
jgi:hypothetical protein